MSVGANVLKVSIILKKRSFTLKKVPISLSTEVLMRIYLLSITLMTIKKKKIIIMFEGTQTKENLNLLKFVLLVYIHKPQGLDYHV